MTEAAPTSINDTSGPIHRRDGKADNLLCFYKFTGWCGAGVATPPFISAVRRSNFFSSFAGLFWGGSELYSRFAITSDNQPGMYSLPFPTSLSFDVTQSCVQSENVPEPTTTDNLLPRFLTIALAREFSNAVVPSSRMLSNSSLRVTRRQRTSSPLVGSSLDSDATTMSPSKREADEERGEETKKRRVTRSLQRQQQGIATVVESGGEAKLHAELKDEASHAGTPNDPEHALGSDNADNDVEVLASSSTAGPANAAPSTSPTSSPSRRQPTPSPGLAKILHPNDAEFATQLSAPSKAKGKGKGKGKAVAKDQTKPLSSSPISTEFSLEVSEPVALASSSAFSANSSVQAGSSSSSHMAVPASRALDPEPLSAYTCPICFFPPTNATITPCGHICCGSCLFTAVKTTMQRGAEIVSGQTGAKCPVCRADIPGWDGKGGGVIGLKPRTVISL